MSTEVKVKISYNPEEEMMSIETDEGTIFYGNYSDFDRTPKGVGRLLQRCGLTVKVDKDLPAIG